MNKPEYHIHSTETIDLETDDPSISNILEAFNTIKKKFPEASETDCFVQSSDYGYWDDVNNPPLVLVYRRTTINPLFEQEMQVYNDFLLRQKEMIDESNRSYLASEVAKKAKKEWKKQNANQRTNAKIGSILQQTINYLKEK